METGRRETTLGGPKDGRTDDDQMTIDRGLEIGNSEIHANYREGQKRLCRDLNGFLYRIRRIRASTE